jgi:hypothetical protein
MISLNMMQQTIVAGDATRGILGRFGHYRK